MSLDNFVTLGRSGLRVSPFCLGTMTFGEDLGWGASPEESAAMIAEFFPWSRDFGPPARLFAEACERAGVPVLRRESGGRAKPGWISR